MEIKKRRKHCPYGRMDPDNPGYCYIPKERDLHDVGLTHIHHKFVKKGQQPTEETRDDIMPSVERLDRGTTATEEDHRRVGQYLANRYKFDLKKTIKTYYTIMPQGRLWRKWLPTSIQDWQMLVIPTITEVTFMRS